MLNIAYRAISRINRNMIISKINRRRLKNHNFTILSNNCVGALISHDLGERFLTPTVNLFLGTEDFVKFVENLDYYLGLEVVESPKVNVPYPVGLLGDLELHFVHYSNIEEAIVKWVARSKRMVRDNMFIMMTDNDGCSEEIIKRFEDLPYKNKVFFTKEDHKKYKSTFYIRGFEGNNAMGDLTAYKNILGQKVYDNFDYISWLNQTTSSLKIKK